MYLDQNSIEGILKLSPEWNYVQKYTNQYNNKYFILRSQVKLRDYKRIFTMDYLAIPKFTEKETNTEVTLTFGLGTMYSLHWGIRIKDKIDFLNNYGLHSFKKILNEQKDPTQLDLEMILTSTNPTELEPLFLNGNLITPIDQNDNLRLRYTAVKSIFHYLLNKQNKSEFFEQDLRNECFVPDEVFYDVFEDFKRNNYIDIENYSLTDKGKKYYKNIEDDPMYDHLLKDKVNLIKLDGRLFENISASVQKGKIFFSDAFLPIEEGDKIERKLPNKLTETFIVVDRGYYEGIGGVSAHYQTKVVRESEYKSKNESKNINYNIQSDNSRININSVDNSLNISTSTTTNVFEDIKSTLKKNISNKNELEIILVKLNDLEEAIGSNSFSVKYNNFIQSVAAHMTIITPFLPVLSQLLVK